MKKLLIIMTALLVLTCIPTIAGARMRERALTVREGHISTEEASADPDTILNGVYIGPINVSGLTEEEAREKVQALIDEMTQQRLTVTIADTEDTLPIWDAGFEWVNTDAPAQAVALGKTGNILDRFLKLQKLEEEPYVIPLIRTVNRDTVEGFVGQEADAHNKKPVNMGLVRNDEGEFETTPSETGIRIDEEASIDAICRYLTETWEGGEPHCSMVMEVLEPKGTEEELAKVKDILGEGSTDYSSSSSSRAKNVKNGTKKVNGYVVYPGEEFSVLEHLVPFNEENGYDPAPSYNDGKTEESFGGGICQVSTTLYLAVLRAELEVVERHNHSMSVHYVKPSMDAAIAKGSKDFRFRNNTETPIYIYANASGGYVTMRIYGCETRDPERKVTYESEVTEKKDPKGIKLIADTHHGFGYIHYVQSAQPDIRAKLWKIVTVNGEEVSREEINKSHYEMANETYEIGVVSGSETATNEMFHAIDHNNLDEVNRVINKYGTFSTGN